MKTRTLLALFLSALMVMTAVVPFMSFADETEPNNPDWSLTDDQLPSSTTLVGTTHLPPISNQGLIGSCASQGITYTQMTNAVSRYLHSINPDIEWNPSSGDLKYIMSSKFTYDFSGAGTAWVYNILCEHGVTTMDKFSFPMKNGGYYIFNSAHTPLGQNKKAVEWYVDEGELMDALNFRLNSYEQIWVKPENFGGVSSENIMMTTSKEGQALINKIKNALVDGNVVVTGGISGGWKIDTKLIKGGEIGKAGDVCLAWTESGKGGGHQVSIVGYDDNVECKLAGVTLKGGFLIANSWGTSSHTDGYFWLMYDAMNAKSEYPSINKVYPNRTFAMDQYIFTNWRTGITVGLPELMVDVEVEAGYRESVHIKLVRQEKENADNKVRHTPWLFEYGLGGKQNVHDNYDLEGAKYTFSGKYIYDIETVAHETAHFTLSYDALLKSIPEGKTVADYDWGVRVYSTYGYPITVKGVKLINSNKEVIATIDIADGGIKLPEQPTTAYGPAKTAAKDFIFTVATELLPGNTPAPETTVPSTDAPATAPVTTAPVTTTPAGENDGGNATTIVIVAVVAVVVIGGAAAIVVAKKKK